MRSRIKVGLLILLLIGGFVVRFYNFSRRINFGPEQAMSLIYSAQLLNKPALIGQPFFVRFTQSGHVLFSSPLFNYSLIPVMLLFHYQPVPITAYFAVFNLITGLILFALVWRHGNYSQALITLLVFLFSAPMIYHSLFIWGYNYLPLIGLLNFYYLYLYGRIKSYRFAFLAGIFVGLGVGLQYIYVFTAALSLIVMVFISRKKIVDTVVFLLGSTVALSPLIVFDLKHRFYNLTTAWQFFLDTLHHQNDFQLAPYHFLQFWPITIFIIGLFIFRVHKKSAIAGYILIIGYLAFNLASSSISFNSAVGMSPGFNEFTWQKAANLISTVKPSDYNVAALLDFDTRANPLRYLLTYVYNNSPQSVTDYSEIKTLFVVSPVSVDPTTKDVYELNSFRPFRIIQTASLSSNYLLYTLAK